MLHHNRECGTFSFNFEIASCLSRCSPALPLHFSSSFTLNSYVSRGEVNSLYTRLTFGPSEPAIGSCDYTQSNLQISAAQTTGASQYPSNNYVSVSGSTIHLAPCPAEYGAPPGACCADPSSTYFSGYSIGSQVASALTVGKTNDASLDITVPDQYSALTITVALDFNCRQPPAAGKTSNTYTTFNCPYDSPCTTTRYSSNGFTCTVGDLSGTLTVGRTVFDLSTAAVQDVSFSRAATVARSINAPVLPK
jgi:hypothetical protein